MSTADRYISQNALIKEIAKIHGNLSTKNVGQAIWDTPTADVVEVVRCKDCAHKGAAFCMAGDFPLTKENENCYCSYGERIEENEG